MTKKLFVCFIAFVCVFCLFAQGKPATREELEKAVVETAWAYYNKEDQMQYCSTELCEHFNKYYGGRYRITEGATPEYGTTDTTIYSVCSDFCYKTYFAALGEKLFDSPNYLDSVTTAFWLFCEEPEYDCCLMRWKTPAYKETSGDRKFGVTDTKLLDITKAREFVANHDRTMRPGDIIVFGGHAILYIGNGKCLDCGGKKYNIQSGLELFEPTGAVHNMTNIDKVMLEGKELGNGAYKIDNNNTANNHLVIIRPIDYLLKRKASVLPAAVSREKFPGIEINRTISCSPYGTVETGEIVTVCVEITNNSNESSYALWNGNENGTDYENLKVSEALPTGGKVIASSVTCGGVLGKKSIEWNLSLKAGEVAKLCYDIEVTATRGRKVTLGKEMTDNIPGNSISVAVGGKKIKATAELEEFFNTPQSLWLEKYNIDPNLSDTFLVNEIYGKVLGINLELDSVKQLYEYNFSVETFTNECLTRRDEGSRTNTAIVFSEYSTDLKKMFVSDYFGGRALRTTKNNETINEMKDRYMQPGDIIINIGLSKDYSRVERFRILLADGHGRFVTCTEKRGAGVVEDMSARNALWRSMSYDLFFLLRPSASVSDINAKVYNPAKATVKTAVVIPPVECVPISEEHKAAFAALADNTAICDEINAKNIKNNDFAEYVYEVAGLNLKKILGDKTTVRLIEVIFNQSNSVPPYDYIPMFDNEEGGLEALPVPRLYGGPSMEKDADCIENPDASMLEIGDIIYFATRANSRYWTGVYLGNGKLILNKYTKGVSSEYNNEIIDISSAEVFRSLLKAESYNNIPWDNWFVIRPYKAYSDINLAKL